MKRIFVYGSLRAGQYNHERTGFKTGATHVANGRISGAQLFSLGPYPAIVPAAQSDQVVGEIYDVNEQTFKWVERMEIGAGYERRKVTVRWPSEDDTTCEGEHEMEAEAYFHLGDMSENDLVESGDWVKHLEEETA